jgi:hypothetical protein
VLVRDLLAGEPFATKRALELEHLIQLLPLLVVRLRRLFEHIQRARLAVVLVRVHQIEEHLLPAERARAEGVQRALVLEHRRHVLPHLLRRRQLLLHLGRRVLEVEEPALQQPQLVHLIQWRERSKEQRAGGRGLINPKVFPDLTKH